MTSLTVIAARDQDELGSEPYDRWLLPDGTCMAEFHRVAGGILVRFSGEADFLVDPVADAVEARPVGDIGIEHVEKLFENSILPPLGNHQGGLFLHGSAVAIGDRGIAFLGMSRSGKTTLAGAFAKSGHPFLTEDTIELDRRDGEYWIRPISTALRLFPDSAEYLLGRKADDDADGNKRSYDSGTSLPNSDISVPLKAIFVLGEDHGAALALAKLAPGAALPAILPHAFVLDVEDRERVRGHFDRLADLAERVAVHILEYPRSYPALPQVRSAIIDACS